MGIQKGIVVLDRDPKIPNHHTRNTIVIRAFHYPNRWFI